MSDDVPQVDPVEVQRLVEAGEAVLVDVRDAVAHGASHAAGARGIPIDELEAHAAELAGTRVFTSCGGGTRGPRAAALLRERGVDAAAVKGGLRGWRAAGLPVDEG